MNKFKTVQPSGEPTPEILRFYTYLGHLLLLTTFVVCVLMVFLVGEPYEQTWWIILLTTFLGRAAAVGTGLGLKFHPFFLFYQVVLTELLLVLYIFPIFVRSYRHLTKVPYIGNYLDNLHQVALGYKKRVAPYGVAGLMIFVVFPFWSTGPLVGSIIGYIIGLPSVTTVVSVTVANLFATAAWVWFYDKINDWNSSVAMWLLGIIFALAIGGIVFSKLRKSKKVEKDI